MVTFTQSELALHYESTEHSKDRVAHQLRMHRQLDYLDGVQSLTSVADTSQSLRAITFDYPEGFVLLKDWLAEHRLDTEQVWGIFYQLILLMQNLHQQHVLFNVLSVESFIVHPQTLILRIFDLSYVMPSLESKPIAGRFRSDTALSYVAPEHSGRIGLPIDVRSDLYSLGVLMFALLEGSLPFVHQDPNELLYMHVAHSPSFSRETVSMHPKFLRDIVLKLLEKKPEDRYLSTAGLRHDVNEAKKRIESGKRAFTLGQRNIPSNFNLSKRLVGREEDLEALKTMYDFACSGKTEVVSVSGYSGIGKSALVQTLQFYVAQKRGLYAYGKFYADSQQSSKIGVFTAFNSLIEQLRSEALPVQEEWKARFITGLGDHIGLIAEYLPSFAAFMGQTFESPNYTFDIKRKQLLAALARFIELLCDRDSALVFVLDDVQWAEPGAFEVVQHLLTHTAMHQKLLFILLYRDNEVEKGHPLLSLFDELRASAVGIKNLHLYPLQVEHVSEFLSLTFYRPEKECMPLAHLLMQTTLGNPFYLSQLLGVFYQKGYIAFDHESGEWAWNLDAIRGHEVPDDVVDLLIDKITHLPDTQRNLLVRSACIGPVFSEGVVSHLVDDDDAVGALQGLIQLGFIRQIYGVPFKAFGFYFKFIHDKVHQAAYSVLNDEEKPALHTQIAKLILEASEGKLDGLIAYRVADHFNAGLPPTSADDRILVANMNYQACLLAKSTTDYDLARRYVKSGLSLLTDDDDGIEQLRIDLLFEYAECAYLSGLLSEAWEQFDILLSKPLMAEEKIKIYTSMLRLTHHEENPKKAIAIGRKALQLYGISLSTTKIMWLIKSGLLVLKLRRKLGKDPVTRLLRLEHCEDEQKIALTRILGLLGENVYTTSQELFGYLLLKMFDLSLDDGASVYTNFAIIGYSYLDIRAGRYNRAYEMGSVAIELSESFSTSPNLGKTLCIFHSHHAAWKYPLRLCVAPTRKSFSVCRDSGDVWFASASVYMVILLRFYAGEDLEHVYNEFYLYEPFLKKHRITNYPSFLAYKHMVSLLMGKEDPAFPLGYSPETYVDALQDDPGTVLHVRLFTTTFDYLMGRPDRVVADVPKFSAMLSPAEPTHMHNHFLFIHALSLAATVNHRSDWDRRRVRKTLKRYQAKFKKWILSCPENFEHKYMLITAEIARLDKNIKSTVALYEQAISIAREHKFTHHVAISEERLASFFLELGLTELAMMYMKKAKESYLSWGAEGVVARMEDQYGDLLREYDDQADNPAPQVDIAPVLSLDLRTLLSASQVISEELVFENLLKKLLEVLIKTANAQRGVMMMMTKGQLIVQAESYIETSQVSVMCSVPLRQYENISLSMAEFVAREQKPIVCKYAAKEWLQGRDPYLSKQDVKSVICMPIMRQKQLVGVVYLENNLMEGAFTEDRIDLLDVLGTQAAISLQNAILYNENQDLIHNLEKRVREQVKEIKKVSKEKDESQAIAEKASEQAAYATLTRGIAHEIRNPLAMILSGIELTLDNLDNQEMVKKFAGIVKESIVRLTDITNAMLRYGSPVSDFTRDVNVTTVARDTMLMAGVEAKKRSVKLIEHLEDVPTFKGDPSSIGQACLNLVLNGMQAIDETGTIEVSTGVGIYNDDQGNAKQGVFISIKDDGVGMTDAEKEKAFNPFYTTKYGNTGLGLSIVWRTIEEHRGTIDVDSEKGVGTTITLHLPLD